MRRGLDVLLRGPARYSNLTARGSTTHDGHEQGRTIYHQTADQLIADGYATRDGDDVVITTKGQIA
jgi:hypothetical protein